MRRAHHVSDSTHTYPGRQATAGWRRPAHLAGSPTVLVRLTDDHAGQLCAVLAVIHELLRCGLPSAGDSS